MLNNQSIESPAWKKSEFEIAESIIFENHTSRLNKSQESINSSRKYSSPSLKLKYSPLKSPIRLNHHFLKPLSSNCNNIYSARSSRLLRKQEQLINQISTFESKQRVSLPHFISHIDKSLNETNNNASRASFIINSLNEMTHMKSEKLFSNMYLNKVYIKTFEKMEAPNSIKNHRNLISNPIRTVAKCERSEIFKKRHNYYSIIKKRSQLILCK